MSAGRRQAGGRCRAPRRTLSCPIASRTERSTCSFSVRASRLDESVSRKRSADSRASRRPPSRCRRGSKRATGGTATPHSLPPSAAVSPTSLSHSDRTLHSLPSPRPVNPTLSRSYMRAPLSVISDATARRAARSLGRAEKVKPSAPRASPSSPAASASWHVLTALQGGRRALLMACSLTQTDPSRSRLQSLRDLEQLLHCSPVGGVEALGLELDSRLGSHCRRNSDKKLDTRILRLDCGEVSPGTRR